MEENFQTKLNRAFNFYLQNALLRNISSLILDIIYLSLMCFTIYLIFITPTKNIHWGLLIFSLIIIFFFKRLSFRLRITRVCPYCLENRGISNHISKTGNTRNYKEYIQGDYWQYEQEVEYLEETFCNYCSYEETELYWEKEHWKGDLTEEARIKKAAKAHQEAETQARLIAYEEIRRRNRYY